MLTQLCWCWKFIDKFLQLLPFFSVLIRIWWLFLLNKMHQLPKNMLQHIPSSLEYNKVRVMNIGGTSSYFRWKTLIKITKFNKFQLSDLYWLLL